MKNGIVGRPMRRPTRARSPAARNAPPSATSAFSIRSPTTGEERDEVLGTADDDEAIAGLGALCRIGRDDRRVAPQDRGDRHARAAADLEVGDGAADRR